MVWFIWFTDKSRLLLKKYNKGVFPFFAAFRVGQLFQGIQYSAETHTFSLGWLV